VAEGQPQSQPSILVGVEEQAAQARPISKLTI